MDFHGDLSSGYRSIFCACLLNLLRVPILFCCMRGNRQENQCHLFRSRRFYENRRSAPGDVASHFVRTQRGRGHVHTHTTSNWRNSAQSKFAGLPMIGSCWLLVVSLAFILQAGFPPNNATILDANLPHELVSDSGVLKRFMFVCEKEGKGTCRLYLCALFDLRVPPLWFCNER